MRAGPRFSLPWRHFSSHIHLSKEESNFRAGSDRSVGVDFTVVPNLSVSPVNQIFYLNTTRYFSYLIPTDVTHFFRFIKGHKDLP